MEKQTITLSQPTQTQYESYLFLTKKKDGSVCPAFNLKELNQFVLYEHFKMEGIAAVVDMLQSGDWMIKIDLKDAYFAVSIAPKDQKFLKFWWLKYCFA